MVDLAKIKEAMDKINKTYGDGTIAMAASKEAMPPLIYTSTGIADLDRLLGGGFAKGKIIMIYGPEGSGKSSLAMHMLSKYEVSAYIDAERGLAKERLLELSVDLKKMILVKPDHGEQALSTVIELADSGIPFIVVDSVAALVPKKEFELEENTEKQAGFSLTAGLLSRKIFAINNICSDKGTTVLFINQDRSNVGAMPFGPQTHPPGGHALMHACHVILRSVRKAPLKVSNNQVGMIVRFYTGIKNRSASPFQEAEIPFIFDKGFVDPEKMQFEMKEARKRQIAIEKTTLRKATGYEINEEEEKTNNK